MRGILIVSQAGILTLLAVIGAHGGGDHTAYCPTSAELSATLCDL